MSIFMTTTFRRVALASAIALGIFGSSNSFAATSSTTATANVVTSLTIAKDVDQSFGDFIAGATTGTVAVATGGTTQTVTGGVTAANGTISGAQFTVNGENDATYNISITAPASLTDSVSTETMGFTLYSDTATGSTADNLSAGTGTLDASGTQIIYLGGELAVAANQAVGTYTGNIDVTVTYP